MDCFRIIGNGPLQGVVEINGAKNAVLPLIACGLLTDQELFLENVPLLGDVHCMIQLVRSLGMEVARADHSLALKTPSVTNFVASYDHVRKMRASVLVLGSLLGRCGKATVSLPGGCAIGPRPVDLHIQGLEAFGVHIDLVNGYIVAHAPGGRVLGGKYTFPKVSVGGTENLILAAVLAKGESCIENAAQEPEVSDLIECLCKMGAEIEGKGTSTLHIQGKDFLSGARHCVLPDRLEMGTYIAAALATKGELVLKGCNGELMASYKPVLDQMGALLREVQPSVFHIKSPDSWPGFHIQTQPFPGFPTDLQAQFMVLALFANSTSSIEENLFENRFMHVAELNRMGANITVEGKTAFIPGQAQLIGAPVMATDLRASVSLVLAALAAHGETIVRRVYHLDRGYEDLVGKLSRCGAQIERLTQEPGQTVPRAQQGV